ncbi:MAG TPA: protein kinase [Polyangiaceae bacterium]|nr:protein kinase [Polyangiaceae bacterium]
MTGQRDGQGAGAPNPATTPPEAEARPPDVPQAPVQATLRSAQPSSADALTTLVSEREPETPPSRRRPAAIARQLGGGRFELSEHLGAGSMGVVYAAFDRQKKERVALKTLQNLEATSIQRLKQEFRSLASVAHPNLVRLRELFADADEVFFTMDLVDGLPLSKFLEADPIRRGDLQLLRNAFRQLAEGLGALHSYGKIHRDLKPSNVMVRNDGRVVVLDFGVTCDVDAARGASERGMIAGTPAYMAPEQVNGEITSIASDWYAFGTMLYEALTGRLPFDGALLELLNAKTSGAALPIESPEVPADLKALCAELLSRSADSRPRGAEVRARLGAEPESVQNDSRRPPGSSGKKAEFVGREQQLRALETALHRTLQGELVTLLVSGASGIGKTTLVKEFLGDDCEAKGALVLQSKCFEQEFVRYNAFDGVIDGLRSYLRRLTSEAQARLTPRHAGALAAVFPTLGDVLARDAPRERLPAQAGERRRMAFHALRELLGRLAETTPVVMFLDDLQWGDSDSARLLAVLLAEPDPPPILIVGSCRSDERAASSLIRTLELEGKGVWNPVELELSPLPDAEAAHLVSRLLGAGARAGVDSIVADAGGNPFFLLEMALAAQESTADLRGAPLADVIASRVASLPPDARSLLEAVAIAERPIAVHVVETAARGVDDTGAGWLALKRAKLVRSVFSAGEALTQCYHDRIRETVKGALDESRAAELHERVGEALEAVRTTDPEQLAEHFHRCKNLEKAKHYARLAGDSARAALAFARAARWYGLAFELSAPDDASKKSLRVDLAEALENAGHAYQAAEHYLAAAAEEADAGLALDFRRRAAGQLLGSAHTDEGLAVLVEVLRAVGLRSPSTMAGAVAALVWDRTALRLRGLEFVERKASDIKRSDLQRIDAVAVAAAGFTRSDFLRGAVFACKELRLALEAGEITRIGRALGSELLFVANEGISQSERTAALRLMAETLMAKIQDERVLGYLKGCAGSTHFLLGDSRSATPELAEAVALLERGRPSWELTFTRGMWGLSLQVVGKLVEVGVAYTNWLADARERADLQAERYFAINHTFSYLGLDQADAGHENLRRALASTEKAGNDFLHFAGLHAFVLIASYRHEGPETFERLAMEHQAFWRSPLRGGQLSRTYVRVYLGYCALAVEAYKRAQDRDLRAVHRIANDLFKERARYAEAHGRLIKAAALRLEGKPSDAAAELAVGAGIFAELGQELQAGAARYQLGNLLGNEEGRALVSQALAVARHLDVKDPIRMYEAYTPGFWP